MINWKWKVRALTIRPDLNSLQNVVAIVHWSLVIIENDVESEVRQSYTYLTPPAEGPQFIAYENLTEEQCILWVKEFLGPSQTAVYEGEIQHMVLLKQGVSAENSLNFPWIQNN